MDSGVAKDANLYSVRIEGEPPYSSTWATAISGMDAVSRLHDINSKRYVLLCKQPITLHFVGIHNPKLDWIHLAV